MKRKTKCFGPILFLAILAQTDAKCSNNMENSSTEFTFVKCTYKYEQYDYKLECEEPETQLFCEKTSLNEMHSSVLNSTSGQKGKVKLIVSDSVLSTDETVREWTNVTELYIQNVLFSDIDDHIFKGFRDLETLEITESKISKIAANAFKTLGRLSKLNISGNTIMEMDKDSLVGLESLTYLSLKENNLTALPVTIFADLKIVETIDLSYNKLETVETAFPGHLTELMLNDNHIKGSLDFSIMPRPVHLLDLKNNKIETLVNFTDNEAIEIKLSNNQIKELPSTGKMLTRLDISLNNIKAIQSVSLHNLGFLNASHNEIETIASNAFLAADTLLQLDLSNNDLGVLPHGCFNHLTSLHLLNLSHNHISNFTFGLMDPLENLETLDISYNNHTVDLHTLMNLHELIDLRLAGNNIEKLDPQIIVDHFRSLRKLSIDDTLWNCKELAEVVAVIEKKSDRNIVIEKGGTKDFTNVRGIKCTDDPVSKLEYIALDQNQLHPKTMDELASTFLQVQQHNHKKLAEILHEMQKMKDENGKQFLKPIRETMLEMKDHLQDVTFEIRKHRLLTKESAPPSSLGTFMVFITLILILILGVMMYNVFYVRGRSRSTADQINLM